MKKQSSRRQPQNNSNSKPEFFETFPYPGTDLFAYLFLPKAKVFLISLRDSDVVVRYEPADHTGFILWLWQHDVRDIDWQKGHMLSYSNIEYR